MGVQGLWSILHCVGKDIDLSSLEGKILAIDMSIWLNQALKSANESPNAHLQLLFKRICKLMFYKIKPVFVFDGPTPTLKKNTLEQRRRQRQIKQDKTEQIKSKILNLMMKKSLISKKTPVVDRQHANENDLFLLPENELLDNLLRNKYSGYDYVEFAEEYVRNFPRLDEVDIESEAFLALPLEVQHEVVRTIAEEKRYGHTSNQSQLAAKSGTEFSELQMRRLLERSALQTRMDKLKTNMSSRNTERALNDFASSCAGTEEHLQQLVSGSGVTAHRVLSHHSGHLLLIDTRDVDTDDVLLAPHYQKKQPSAVSQSKLQSKDMREDKSQADLKSLLRSATRLIKPLLDGEKMNFSEVAQNSCTSQEVAEDNQEGIENTVKENLYIYQENSKMQERPDRISKENPIFSATNSNINSTGTSKNDSQHNIISFSNYIRDKECSGITEDNVQIALPECSTEKINSETLESNNLKKSDSEDEEDDHDFIYVEDEDVEDNAVAMSNEFGESSTLIGDRLSQENRDSEEELRRMGEETDEWENEAEERLQQMRQEESKLARETITITDQYYQEAKELLRLFGLPFVESPGEAEAQCAQLERVGLVHGCVTEDSDVWLFGANTVYKHIFSKNMQPRRYCANSIRAKLGLSRDLMVCIALLSGSDYTPGVHGVGPVIAMEILADFSEPSQSQTHMEVLQAFKKWYNKNRHVEKKMVNEERRRYLRFNIDKYFPDPVIFEAYSQPLVDESEEPFVWSKPNIEKLLELAELKLGMARMKAIETLQLLERSGRYLQQYSLLDFFSQAEPDVLAARKSPSKRLKMAIDHRNAVAAKKIKKI